MKQPFYFPLLFLHPRFEPDLTIGRYSAAVRRWSTSTFDLATLATQHDLHLPYQVMDVMLARCNIELAIDDAPSHKEAIEQLDYFRVGAYLAGCSPFVTPFVTTRSINEYSGINERDSALHRGVEPKIPSPFSSVNGKLSAWPIELSFFCMTRPNALDLTEERFKDAVRSAEAWAALCKKTSVLRALTAAFMSAPLMGTREQSLLHIWTAIESLFPTVSTEVSFRLGLYLTVLCALPKDRSEFHRKVKVAYGIRSKVAHGALSAITIEQWDEAWHLLCGCARAIVARGAVPSEPELLEELFRRDADA
ncbi:MAG: HEPN domain-containing protein [Burkholderiaceae bacterium]|nr:HEPN domain-containing protein [Burkholderiaceae bacterium]